MTPALPDTPAPRRGPSRRTLLAALPAGAATGLAAPALAAGLTEWRMVTSWPRNLPGPGVSAQRVADAITRLSDGRLRVRLSAAGELVPGFGVLDAVASGTAEMGHTASVFHAGRAPAAALFTSAPFGLTPVEHLAWVEQGGGQQLWQALYRPFGVRPMLAGNTGPSMGGWFREAVGSLDDLAGRRMRIAGLGAELMRRLGVVPVAVPPAEIFPSLASGVIDGAEFTAPASDFAMGLHQAAPHYYGPGFHEPNGAGEAIVALPAWEALDDTLRAVVDHAARAEHATALGDAWAQNTRALDQLAEAGVVPARWPGDVLAAAAEAAPAVYADLAASDADAARIVGSYRAAVERARAWSNLSLTPFLAARG